MTNPITYQPREGSKPAHVIAVLQGMAPGSSLTVAELSELCNTAPKNVSPNMEIAVKNGLLNVIDNAQGLKAYTLGDGTPPAAGADKRAVGRRPGSTVKQKARTQASAKTTEPVDADDDDLTIAVWDDGDVVVGGITPNEDGTSVTFTRGQINRIFSALTRPHTTLAAANHWPLLNAPDHTAGAS